MKQPSYSGRSPAVTAVAILAVFPHRIIRIAFAISVVGTLGTDEYLVLSRTMN